MTENTQSLPEFRWARLRGSERWIVVQTHGEHWLVPGDDRPYETEEFELIHAGHCHAPIPHHGHIRARAEELGVTMKPGWYWGKPTPSSHWSAGRVLSYDCISGPAGTVWFGNGPRTCPVGDMHKLIPLPFPEDT